MLTDPYGLPLSTTSSAARDAYAEAFRLALTLYPGALEAFEQAIAADPAFALAHAGKAQVLVRDGHVTAGRAALATALGLAAEATPRERGHLAFFDHAFAGRTDAAIATLYTQLANWPRDALMVAASANPNGLIGGCGRIGQKRQIAALMDGIAPHYGDDAWFLSYHAMALSEDGQIAAARPKIERSAALNPVNAHVAHGMAHVCYEGGELNAGRDFLASWLPTYPRDGFFHGHLSWHLALFEIGAGDRPAALCRYRDAVAFDRHSGGPHQKVTDGAGFLWRSELAGYPRDMAAWRATCDFASTALPRPGAGLSDLHVLLTKAVMRDDAALDERVRRIEELAGDGRYPSGTYLPALSRGFVAFERGDFSTAIAVLAPLVAQAERIGGSRAQHDLIELTLLRACLEAGRTDDARSLLSARRPGAIGPTVAGLQVS